VTEVIRLPK
jgi:hypothetical protein